MGRGLGTAGRTQQQRGRFYNIASFDVDNSYLKVGMEQGFFVMLFFGLAMAVLLAGLMLAAVRETVASRAALLIGAAGALTAMAILFYAGTYVEDLTALAGWILVGLGISVMVWRRPQDEAV